MQQWCIGQHSLMWIHLRQDMAVYHRSYRTLCEMYLKRFLSIGYRRTAYLFAVVVGCMILILVKLKTRGIDGGSSYVFKINGDGTYPLLILYWTNVFDVADWGFGAHLQHCQHLKDKCVFSTDRSLYRIADVMLLHMRDAFQIPKYRSPYQKWVFGLMESPVYTGLNLHQIRGLFNVTMTYKRGSNIPWLYGRFAPLPNNTIATKLLAKHRRTNFAACKKHVAAWFTSHCHPQSKRDEYVNDLLPFLNIHIYGECGGNYSCPKDDAERCLEKVNTDYKFIFAFENSLCEDYITEKVWQIMQRQINVVPVVRGYSKYAELLPPHSFIDVSDFPSPEALAKHLKRVAADKTLYNEYFRWRTTHTCLVNDPPMGCQVCENLLMHRGKQQTVDVEQFWAIETNCVEPEQFNARWQPLDAKVLRETLE